MRRQAAGAHMGEEEGCQASQTGGETTTGAHVMCVHALTDARPPPTTTTAAPIDLATVQSSSSSGASRRPIEQSAAAEPAAA